CTRYCAAPPTASHETSMPSPATCARTLRGRSATEPHARSAPAKNKHIVRTSTEPLERGTPFQPRTNVLTRRIETSVGWLRRVFPTSPHPLHNSLKLQC